MLYATLQYTVPESASEPCKDAIRELMEHIREKEPGTLWYLVLLDSDGGDYDFLHLAAFEDMRGLEAHRDSSAMGMFQDLIYPETEHGIAFTPQTVLDRIEPRQSAVEA